MTKIRIKNDYLFKQCKECHEWYDPKMDKSMSQEPFGRCASDKQEEARELSWHNKINKEHKPCPYADIW